MKSVRELIEHVPQVGRVQWIGLRPERGAPVVVVDRAEVIIDRGLRGDRTADHARPGRSRGTRHVSLIAAEHLDVLAKYLARDRVDPTIVRRNIVVAGVNLLALARRRFSIGECEFEGTGECHPCSKMETALGEGGYAAMRGHGGILARVVRGGWIRVGDEVRAVASEAR